MLYFEGVVREAIHHLKYRGCAELAEPLGRVMADYLKEHLMPADVVVPVPLHITRLRERGYNQAALLAHAMARYSSLAVEERALIRERATASQVGLSAEERRLNVKGAFRCIGTGVGGKRVLLIDDVCTTGATLEACAVALYEAGARSVQALTLARAR
ncbi:MAG: ComF family protein [Anaerolineae bacterium]|nr:ComF family protein [Anaerolineae bacterium]